MPTPCRKAETNKPYSLYFTTSVDWQNHNHTSMSCHTNNHLGYQLFAGRVVRGMRGFAESIAEMQGMSTDGELPDFAFEWQKRDFEQCQTLYEAGAAGHVNATNMGMGKTITTIAECLCIRDGTFAMPMHFTPCRDGTTSQNVQFNMLRSEIYRVALHYKRQGKRPFFTDVKAWIDRAWFYLCTNQHMAPELQCINYAVALMTYNDLIDTWRARHLRMYAHAKYVLPRGRIFDDDICDCSQLLVMNRPPVLVVCGSTFASEWFEELEKLTPGSVNVLNLACDYSGTFKNARSRYSQNASGDLLRDILENDYDFIFTTYGYLGNAYSRSYKNSHPRWSTSTSGVAGRNGDEAATSAQAYIQECRNHSNRCALMSVVYSVVVVDEAHKICNSNTVRHNGVRFAKSLFKIFITGTPIQNNISDLRSLLLALNFEHFLLHDAVFQQACQVRYLQQYEHMRQQYIAERAHYLLGAQSQSARVVRDGAVETEAERVQEARALAEDEISPTVCAQISRYTRTDLQQLISDAYESKDPWRFRQLFVAVMSLKQLNSGELVSLYDSSDADTALSNNATCRDGIPRYVTDDGSSIDPIYRVVQYFFHWERQDTLHRHMVEHHCRRRALERGPYADSLEEAEARRKDRRDVEQMLEVTHTLVERPFMFDYEMDMYSSVCRNTIAVMKATSKDECDMYTDAQLKDMHASIQVAMLRMQQVCMSPALPFLPSGEFSVEEVQMVRNMITDRINDTRPCRNSRLGESEQVSWYAEDMYTDAPVSLDDARRAFGRHAVDADDRCSRERASQTDDTADDDAFVDGGTIDTLALQKRLLVPYSMFSRVVDPRRHIVMPGTKETMLYQLFTNQLPEMLDGNKSRLVTSRTKIIVYDTYPIMQVLHQRAAYKAFGANSSVCISGKVCIQRREELRNMFKRDPRIRVLFLTLETGAHALNIPEADIMVFMNPWWNPFKSKQAMHRGLRPSRMHPLHVYNFTIVDTIETHVVQRQNEKKEITETMLAYDDPVTGILQTNGRLRALQRFDASVMRQVASDMIKCRKHVNYRYARSFIDSLDSAHSDNVERESDPRRGCAVETETTRAPLGHVEASYLQEVATSSEKQYRTAFDAFVQSARTDVLQQESGVDVQILAREEWDTMQLSPHTPKHRPSTRVEWDAGGALFMEYGELLDSDSASVSPASCGDDDMHDAGSEDEDERGRLELCDGVLGKRTQGQMDDTSERPAVSDVLRWSELCTELEVVDTRKRRRHGFI